jgi:hypothetical protein
MSWRRSGRLPNCTWRGPPRVHQKAKPETSSSYRRPPIMTSSDLRGRTSAHGTGRPSFIGPWQIGPSPGGEGRARTTPLTAHVGQTSVSPTRGRLPASINSVVSGRPWASAGSSCFMVGAPLLRVMVSCDGEPEIKINTCVDQLRSGLLGRPLKADGAWQRPAVGPRSKHSYRNNAGEEAGVVRVGAAARRPPNASAGNRPRRADSSLPGQPG